MQEVSEVEAARLASAFRPNRKPLIVTVLANLILALLLLGVPYWRGQRQASAARLHFAELSRCLMGGEIAPVPGLSLPQGDRDHFAANVLRADASWPLSCRPALQRLAPEPAVFLWPSVKQAGADLRSTVELADRELATLAKRRKEGLHRVPERPLSALRRLQAATVLLARAGGAESELDNDALVWKTGVPLVMPARLPLTASEDASLDLYSDGHALEALALDTRGFSYLRVADGKVDRERVRRTSFVRALTRAGSEPLLVWAMPDSRCAEREDRCAGRPLGLARYEQGAGALKEPGWKLAGHPAGRSDRVLKISPSGRVTLLARSSARGGVELLRFELPLSEAAALGGSSDPSAAGSAAPKTIEPTGRWVVRDDDPAGPEPSAAAAASPLSAGAEPNAGPSPTSNVGQPPVAVAATLAAGTSESPSRERSISATLIEGGELSGALLAEARDGSVHAQLVWADAGRARLTLPAASGSESPWAVGCASADATLLAYGSSAALQIVRVDAAGNATVLLSHAERLGPPLDAEDPARDRLRLRCNEAGGQLVWSNLARELWTTTCSSSACAPPLRAAEHASYFSLQPVAAGSVIAFGSLADEVRVLRLDAQGRPSAPAYAPAACFEPPSGMCGIPSLIADPQRLVLTARDRSDLLALESTDGGASFTTLSGLVGSAKIEQSTTSPLKQHRARKGLE